MNRMNFDVFFLLDMVMGYEGKREEDGAEKRED